MSSLAVGLLSFLLVAAKFMVLGSLVLAGIGAYALYRLTVWCVNDLFGLPVCRRPPPVRPARGTEFVARYPQAPPRPAAPRPQVVPVAAARIEKANTGNCSWNRNGTPSWSQVAIGLVFFALVALGFRAKQLVAIDGEISQRPAAPPATVKKVKGRSVTPAPTPPPAPPNVPPVAPEACWSTTVTAAAGSLEAARQKALKRAYDEFLDDYLRNQNPAIEWKPAWRDWPDFVREHLNPRRDEKIKEDDPHLDELEKVDRIYEVSLAVEVLPKNRAEILKLNQLFHSEQRMVWLAKVFGCLIAFLASIAAYVRLDEWTKGYYSGWLRLAAAGFVGAAGAGLWVLLGR